MTQQDAVTRWRESALRDLQIAEDMMRLKHYDWALYLGQLTLEKLLKGLVTKATNEAPPFIHDLVKLASLAQIDLSEAQRNDFHEISTFHVKARYEDIKSALYKKATKTFAETYTLKIKEYVVWLKKQY